MSALQNQNIDWKKLNPEFSGEIWLAFNSGKATNLHDIKKWGATKTRESDKQFDGFVQTESLDEPLENGELTKLDVLHPDDLEPAWNKRCGLGEFENDVDVDSMIGQYSPILRDIAGLLGKSCRTLLSKSSTSKSIPSRTQTYIATSLERDLIKARKDGKSVKELVEIAESRLGKYFPEVVQKYNAKPGQQDLFGDEGENK